MSNDEILKIADDRLNFSDFGNYYGSENDILEFASEIIRKAIIIAHKDLREHEKGVIES